MSELNIKTIEPRPAKFERYKPKRWHPEFDLIILDSISGLDNIELGRKYGYTPQHISNILSTEEARKVKERVRTAIDKEIQGGVKERLSKVGEKVLEHIERFVEDDNNLAEKRPFEFIDRAVRIGEKVGSLIGDVNKNVTNNIDKAIFLSADQAKGIKDGLFLSSKLDDIEPIIKPEETKFTVHKLAIEK
jgi:ElaB/YqjD/DUF883 family membrane-anchored ribosome-binding protein